MIRLRMAAIAAATSLAFVGVAAPVAAAANGTGSQFRAYNFPALYTVAVNGTAKGNRQFKGTLGIQRFVDRNGKVYADGTLSGTLAGHHLKRYGVLMPASLNQNPNGSADRAHAAQSCQVLNLVIGPISLNLLGLVVTTNAIHLNITAVSGPGNLLGNLLCSVSNLLNGGTPTLLSQIEGDLTQLTALFNSLLGDLKGLAGGL